MQAAWDCGFLGHAQIMHGITYVHSVQCSVQELHHLLLPVHAFLLLAPVTMLLTFKR